MDYLNDEIRHVATWIKANKLFIKVKKTKIMIFRTKQKFLATRLLKIGNTIIEDFIAWKIHIDYICTNISKTIGMLYETRFHLLRKSLLLLPYSSASCDSLSWFV